MDLLGLLGKSETEGEDISREMWMQLSVFDKDLLLVCPRSDGLLGGDQHHADLHDQLGAREMQSRDCTTITHHIVQYTIAQFQCV